MPNSSEWGTFKVTYTYKVEPEDTVSLPGDPAYFTSIDEAVQRYLDIRSGDWTQEGQLINQNSAKVHASNGWTVILTDNLT